MSATSSSFEAGSHVCRVSSVYAACRSMMCRPWKAGQFVEPYNFEGRHKEHDNVFDSCLPVSLLPSLPVFEKNPGPPDARPSNHKIDGFTIPGTAATI